MLNIPQTYQGKRLIHSWIYRATDGTPLGVAGRYEGTNGKKRVIPFFKQNGNHWTAGIDLNPRPLFGLEKLAIHPKNKAVFVVEGEKCAAALQFIGCCVVTSVLGSQAANQSDWSPLNGFEHVIILPDNDAQGLKYAQDVAALLSSLERPPKVEIKQLEGLPDKGDIVDWLKLHVPEWDEYQSIDANKAEDSKLKLSDALKNARILEAVKASSEASAWPELQEINPQMESELYPLDALPNTVRMAVEEVANFVQAPLPLVVCSALACLSLAIQPHVDVKRAEKLDGPSSLYMLVIADSGERKSTCDGFFMKPIYAYQEKKSEEAKLLLDTYHSAKDAWDAKYGAIKEKIKGQIKKVQSTEQEEAQLRQLQTEKPQSPKMPRLLYADFTPEALAFSLVHNTPSAGVISSEAGTVFGSHGMGKDSAMRNLAFLNQLWEGGTVSIDRKTSDSFTVSGVRLTVALQVQSDTLQEFFCQSGRLARGTGFLARFLLAHPQSTQGSRLFKEAPVDWPNLGVFHAEIEGILNKQYTLNDAGNLKPDMISFSPEAKKLWISYHDEIELMLRRHGELYDVKDIASKSADNAARLAALFQVFEYGFSDEICVDSFERASRIAAWHLSESLRFFSAMPVSAELASTTRLDAWLVKFCAKNRQNCIDKRTVRQYGPLRNNALLEPRLTELAELGRARLVQQGQSTIVEINPQLLEECHEP